MFPKKKFSTLKRTWAKLKKAKTEISIPNNTNKKIINNDAPDKMICKNHAIKISINIPKSGWKRKDIVKIKKKKIFKLKE